MTDDELLARWPQLNTLPRRDWQRAAAHLSDAADARAAGVECPWCYRPPRGHRQTKESTR